MLALIKTRSCVKASPFERIIKHYFFTRDIHFEIINIFGVRTLECTIDIQQKENPHRTAKKVERAIGLLASNKFSTVIPAVDFPLYDFSERYGISIPDTKKLWAKTAGKIASFVWSGDIHSMSVAMYAKRINVELDDAVRSLLPLARRLTICCSGNIDGYVRGLLREFGISVLTTYNAAASADIHLMFQRPPIIPTVKSSAIAAQFYGNGYHLPCRTVLDVKYRWPDRIPVPNKYPKSLLFAGLYEVGAVRKNELKIESIRLSNDAK